VDVTNPPPGVTEMADVLPDGLVVVDGQQTLVFCSARAGRLMDVDYEGILGRPVREVLPLHDSDGRAYLDFANGIAVTSLGHAHPRVTAAIHAQVDKLIGPINAIGFTAPISDLATALAATFPDPLDSVMFLNSGSEAIE